MAIERKEVVLYIGKVLRYSIRLSYKFACDHPIFFSMGLLLFLLYRSFPSLFSFLLSSSPVIVCTTLLLGVLLSCGESRIPEIEEEKEEEYKNEDEISVLKVGTSNNDADESFTEQTYMESTAKEMYLSEERTNKEFGIEEEVDEESEHLDQGVGEKRELSEEKPAEEAAQVGEDVGCSSSINLNPAEGLKIDGHNGFLNSEPDIPLSSYPNPSMIDLTLMHDEKPIVEEDRGGEGKEDDQNSVMDLGPSELERYRRLESLIAKRRARKNLRFELEKNLVDLDVNGSASSVDEFSQFHAQIPPISAPRPNPFDLFNDSEETSVIPGSAPSILHPRKDPFDLSPFDQVNESSSSSSSSSFLRENWYTREFMSVSQRDMFFRRHDSFNLSVGELRQEKRLSRFRPYYALDTMDLDLGSSSTTFHRQLSDKSESKLSFVFELDDVVSSVNDQDYCDDSIEKNDDQPYENGSQYSDEVKSLEVEVESSDISSTEGFVSRLNNVELFGSLEEKEDSEEISLSLSVSDAEKFKLIEEKQGGSGSHTLSEATEKKPIPDLIIWEGTGESQILHNTGEGSVGADSSLETKVKLNVSRVVSFPLLVEEKVVSEDGGEMPSRDETNLVNLFSVSSMREKSEARLKETGEYDLIGIESPTVHQASVNPVASEISEGPKAGEDNLIDQNCSENLLLNGLNLYATKPVQPSTQNSLMQPSSEPGLRDSYISVMDLHPIPEVDFPMISEETLEFLKLQKEKGNSTLPDSVLGLTELEVREEQNVVRSDIVREFTHKLQEGSSLDNAPTIHIHDGGFVQLQLLDSIESSNKLSSSAMDSDFLSKPDIDSTESRKDIADAIQNKQVLSSENYLYDSDEECEKIYPDLVGIDDIDEDLLSELDAVGDFLVEELMPGRQFNRMATDFSNTEIHEIPTDLQNSQASLNLSRNFPSRSMEAVGTSFGSSPWDLEQTVYNPRFRILDSSSAEEINMLFKQLQEEEEAEASSVSMPTIDNLSTINKEADSSESGLTESGPKLVEIDSDMVVLEVKHIEDIDSAIKLFNESLDKSSISEIGSSEVVHSEMDFGPTVVNSDIQIIEAKSLDDINIALHQFSKGLDKSSSSEVASSEVIEGERHFFEAMATNSDIQFIEAKSLDDIDVALKQFSEDLDKSSVSDIGSSQLIPGGMDIKPMATNSDIPVIEAKCSDDIDVILKQLSEGLEKSSISDVGSTEVTRGEIDFGPTMINSDIQVIEAKSFDDIDVALKQFSEGLDNSLISEFGSSEVIQGEMNFGLTVANSDIQVIEAKSLDDIDAALKQFSEGGDKSLIPDIGSCQVIQGERHFEPMATNSNIHVIEPKPLDDINVASKHFSGALDNSLISGVGSSKVIQGETDLGRKTANSDVHVIEARSLDDKDAALKQLSGCLDDGNPEVEKSSRHMKNDDPEVRSAKDIEMASKKVDFDESQGLDGLEMMKGVSSSIASTSEEDKEED